MPEIGTSGSMSGDGKRGVAAWPKLPRPSSTLPEETPRHAGQCLLIGEQRTQTWLALFVSFEELRKWLEQHRETDQED